MTQFEWLVLAVGLLSGSFITSVCYCFPMRKLKRQLYKLRGQVYYWSRQMPVAKNAEDLRKVKSV